MNLRDYSLKSQEHRDNEDLTLKGGTSLGETVADSVEGVRLCVRYFRIRLDHDAP